jgi:hypothetical protein
LFPFLFIPEINFTESFRFDKSFFYCIWCRSKKCQPGGQK